MDPEDEPDFEPDLPVTVLTEQEIEAIKKMRDETPDQSKDAE
jgi:hypothetical protein